jgi:acetate kinase
MKILVVNCGSSSIKYQLFLMPEKTVLAKGLLERIGEAEPSLLHSAGGLSQRLSVDSPTHECGINLILKTLTSGSAPALARIEEIGAVGHRVVHGAAEFTDSVLIDNGVLTTIERMADLAPLHNPPNLVGIRATMHSLPGIPQVACFDTAFHSSLPPTAHCYSLPHGLCERLGVRRFGFHGTSHRYVSCRAADLLGIDRSEMHCITCHLGNGCSMTAVRNGRSVDTSMGLTPLEGLVMGTRCGDIDPAILLYLLGHGYSAAALNQMCNKESGLLGISGSSNDMRELEERASAGDRRARLAIDIFCYRVKKYIGAYAAVLGRVDAVVFTGGIGENEAGVRAQCCSDLWLLGIEIDPDRNASARGREGEIQSDRSRVKLLVVPTDEEGAIAGDTYRLVRRD